jgi:hypothetical protein
MPDKRRFTQHCSYPGCAESWTSRLPQLGAILFCLTHQLLLKVRNPVGRERPGGSI